MNLEQDLLCFLESYRPFYEVVMENSAKPISSLDELETLSRGLYAPHGWHVVFLKQFSEQYGQENELKNEPPTP